MTDLYRLVRLYNEHADITQYDCVDYVIYRVMKFQVSDTGLEVVVCSGKRSSIEAIKHHANARDEMTMGWFFHNEAW